MTRAADFFCIFYNVFVKEGAEFGLLLLIGYICKNN